MRFLFVCVSFVTAGMLAGPTLGQTSLADQDAAELQAEREFYEFLMMLDEFGGTLAAADAAAAEAIAIDEAIGLDAAPDPQLVEEPLAKEVDDAWLLAFLSVLDQEQSIEAERALAALAALAQRLATASEQSEGDLQTALDAAAADLERLIMLADRFAPIEPAATRKSIGEAQRVLALYHCRRANRDAEGSLANPTPSTRQRLSDLTLGARLTLAASQTVSYRLPADAKRTLASAIALSTLFPETDVRLRQIRDRARDIERTLVELGAAIRRSAN